MTTSTSPQEILLQIKNLNKNFGGLQAIDDVTLDLPAGVITTLVGPNGAGKTTLFNLITGHLIPTSGTVHWLGKPLKGVQPWQVARLGIARTFQDLRLYSQMTVEENIMTVTERSSWLWQGGRKAAEQRVTAGLRGRSWQRQSQRLWRRQGIGGCGCGCGCSGVRARCGRRLRRRQG